MSQTAVETLKPSKPLAYCHARVKGRIANRRKQNAQGGTFWLTVIKTPARDEFSHPSTIEVTSDRPLGEVGDDWEGVVEISGYARAFNSKPDPETGEIKKINSAQNHLRVVE